MRNRKNQVFLYFNINSESKLEQFSALLLRHLPRKNSLRNLIRFHGGLFESEILEIFTSAFLLKLLFELESTADYSPYFFHHGGLYHIKTSPLICFSNLWTGFHMIRISVSNELKKKKIFSKKMQAPKNCLISEEIH